MMKILPLIIVLISSNIFAQEWEDIGADSDGVYYQYKAHSDNHAWIKSTSEKTSYYVANKLGVKNVEKIIDGYQINLYKFDCSDRQIGLLQVNTYSKSAQLVGTATIEDYAVNMIYVVPDSLGENFLTAFCRK